MFRNKIICLFLFIMLFCMNLFADDSFGDQKNRNLRLNGTILAKWATYITIIDYDTNAGLHNAQIKIDNTNLNFLTDENGIAFVDNLLNNFNYKFIISHDGYIQREFYYKPTESQLTDNIKVFLYKDIDEDINIIVPSNGKAIDFYPTNGRRYRILSANLPNIVIPAFNEKDLAIFGNSNASIRINRSGKYEIYINHNVENKELDSVGISNNIIQCALDNDIPINLSLKDNDSVVYSTTFESDFFNNDFFKDNTMLVEYDKHDKNAWLIFTNLYASADAEKRLNVFSSAYEKAKDDYVGIKAQIYSKDEDDNFEKVEANYQDNEDTLNYEFIFYPDNLQNTKFFDTNLYIINTPSENDSITEKVKNKKVQYVIIPHDGELPTLAVLKIKNLENFDKNQNIDLVYNNPDTSNLEIVQQNIQLQDNNFFVIDVSHCSSYALITDKAENQFFKFQFFINLFIFLMLVILIYIVYVFEKEQWKKIQ